MGSGQLATRACVGLLPNVHVAVLSLGLWAVLSLVQGVVLLLLALTRQAEHDPNTLKEAHRVHLLVAWC